MECQLGSVTVFTHDDFEEDWHQVATSGFSQVFQVRHRCWRTPYAIKCSPWPQQDTTSGSHVNCLIEEAAKMEKIKFQPIVSIYGVCKQPLGIVMEFVAIGSLEKMLPTHQLSWQFRFHIIHKTSLAMNFLHSIQPPLLHLDLKPGNILLDNNMHVKVSDFGLSKWMEQSIRMQYIERLALRGTLSYTRLEMFLESNKAPGPKCDVYSFEIVVWELLTQKKPYSVLNIMTVIIRVAAGMRPTSPLQPVFHERPGEAQQMVDLMRRCWDHDPKKRPCFLGVSEEASQELTDSADSGDYLKRVLQLSDSDSLVPSDEELKVYEKKVTPLHFLVAQGNMKQVDCQTASGYTPLLITAQDQQPNLCALLLEHRASANLVDEDVWAPLHFTAQNGDDCIARLLLDHGALMDAQEYEGWTPLHLDAQNNCENVARLLVSRHAEPNSCEAKGKTPLHMAACFGHVSLVKLLTGQGAELDAQQRNVRIPLHLAVERGKVRAIHLLKSGPSLNVSGYGPLHIAAAGAKYFICTMLLRYGELATYKGHLEIIHVLTKNHADVGPPGGMNWTPLHLAAHNGEGAVVLALLQCGADPDAAEKSGWTPLHLAVQKGAFLSVINLLQHHEDVHTCNKVDWTPAHLAALKGNTAILQMLAKAGAQMNVQDEVGCTPLRPAQWGQKQSIVAFPEDKEPSFAILGGFEPGAQTEV
ncbi:LOW QUALITY PROTEIN: ankyrin repeat and protein kinase domain-containing protein 1 [Ctenodactylus gundi]